MSDTKVVRSKAKPIDPQLVFDACQAFLADFKAYITGPLWDEADTVERATLDLLYGRLEWHGFLILDAMQAWGLARLPKDSLPVMYTDIPCNPQVLFDLCWNRWCDQGGAAALLDFLEYGRYGLVGRMIRDCDTLYSMALEFVEKAMTAAAQIHGGRSKAAVIRQAKRRKLDRARLNREARQHIADFQKEKGRLPKVKELAELLGVSTGIVGGKHGLRAWGAAQAQVRENTPAAPKAVSLTDPLQKLIDEQAADDRTHKLKSHARRP